MANIHSYAGPHTTWSAEPHGSQWEYSPRRAFAGYTLAAAGMTGLAFAGKIPFGDAETLFTKAYRFASVAEQMTPWKVGATFRIPGLLSPFVQHERIVESSGGLFKPRWGAATLEASPFSSRVIGSLLDLSPGQKIPLAQGFEWVGDTRGWLMRTGQIKAGGQTAAENVMLLRRGRGRRMGRLVEAALAIKDPELLAQLRAAEEASQVARATSPAAAAEAKMAAKVSPGPFYGVGKAVRTSEYIPIAIPHLPGTKQLRKRLLSQGSLSAVTAIDRVAAGVFYTRLVGAAGASRLNELIKTLTEQVPVVKDVLGKMPFKLYVKQEASMLRMTAGYMGRAGVVGALALGVKEAGWIRRQDPIAGTAAYAAIGAGAPLAFGIKSPKVSAIAAAVGAGVSIIPGFEHGLVEGMGQAWASLQMGRSRLTNLPIVSWLPGIGGGYRRWIEGNAPGLTNLSTGVGAGLAAVAGRNLWLAAKGGVVGEKGVRIKAPGAPMGSGLGHGILKAIAPDLALANVIRHELGSGEVPKVFGGLGTSAFSKKWQQSWIRAFDMLNKYRGRPSDLWNSIGGIQADLSGGSKVASYMRSQIQNNERWATKILNEKRFWPRIKLQVEAAWSGAAPETLLNETKGWSWRKGGLKGLAQGRWSSPFGRGSTRFLAGMAVWGALTGVLGSRHRPEDLESIYEGEHLLPVRTGRWWEGGGSAWEGTNIDYYRPHWLPRMLSRARERGIWGVNEDETSPLAKWFLKNFTYEQEMRTYKDRPYPITGQGLNDIPFGGFLLDPIGKLIKSPRLMHVEDWMRESGGAGAPQVKQVSKSLDIQPAYGMGGLHEEAPESPFTARRRFSGMFYQNIVEQWGLWGYSIGEAHKIVAGTQTPFEQGSVLAQAGWMTSPIRRFWEEELGGGGFTTEPIRRFMPRPRSGIGQYNPIPNRMPSWLPEDFQTGDPYGKLRGGELRLPGPGYEALHPELQGLNPEEYPLHHRYAILADVAYWSPQFRAVQRGVRWRLKNNMYSDEVANFVGRADAQLEAKKRRREFEIHIGDLNEETKRQGIVGAALGGTWKGLNRVAHDIASGPEKLIPFGFRPVEKLLPELDSIEEYENQVLYGTRFAFWDKPWRDWFRPAMYQTMHDWFGYQGKPGWVKNREKFEQHYDQLEYYKWKRLEAQATQTGQSYKAKQYARFAGRTMTGVDPMDRASTVRSAMPRRDQEFFEAFSMEDDERRRARILEMVHPSLRSVYEAQWLKADYARTGDPELGRAIRNLLKTEGVEDSPGLVASREAEQVHRGQTRLNFGDWWKMRRIEAEMGENMPRPDWVGFNPAVDIEDVKLKVLTGQGYDIHDYGFYRSQRRLLSRKPYLNTEDALDQGNFFRASDRNLTNAIWEANGIDVKSSRSYNYQTMGGRTNAINFVYEDNRIKELEAYRSAYGL